MTIREVVTNTPDSAIPEGPQEMVARISAELDEFLRQRGVALVGIPVHEIGPGGYLATKVQIQIALLPQQRSG